MMMEAFEDIYRPTGRIIKFTPEELEEIERIKIAAEKDFEERMERAKRGLRY